MTTANPIRLFLEVFRKRLILEMRYPANTIIRLLVLYIFFSIVFWGGKAVGGSSMGNTLDGIIVGFFLWALSSTAYMSLANDLTDEAKWGTLEQLFMSAHGITRIVSTKLIVNVMLSFLYATVLLILMMVTTSRYLVIDLVTVVPIAVLAITSVLGIGFALGGLALLYKKIQAIIGLMQFAFIGLISAPSAGLDWAALLPLSKGSEMLQATMRNGTTLTAFPTVDLGILLGTAVGYLLAGYFVFKLSLRRARELGVLGHY